MYSFILNPNAGSGRAAKVRPAIERYMNGAGLGFEIVETSTPEEAVEASRSAATRSDVVVSVGGDGTLHYVAAGIIESRLGGSHAALGVLPVGTGNDFGRMIGMPRDTEAALASMLDARLVAVDHGWAIWQENGVGIRRTFINCAGIGLDAASAILASRLKHFIGNAAYLAAPAITVLRWRSPEARVVISTPDSSEPESWTGRLILNSIANGKWIGGGIEVAPDARVEDRALDMCLISKVSIPKAYLLLAKAANGNHVGRREVLMRKIRRVEVTVSEPLPVYVDGEPGSNAVTQVVFEVAAGELPVLMPTERSR